MKLAPKQHRGQVHCPVCGRPLSDSGKACTYCLREELPREIIRVQLREEVEKNKWIPWFFGVACVGFMIWLLVRFSRFIDDLLQGRL